jgi:peptidylprolyl isomerase
LKLKSIFFFSLLLFLAACSKENNNTSEITTLSGLKYTDILTGSGPSPVPGDKVTIHYTGTLLDGKKFDSSKDRNQPYSFTIGSGGTLLGWEEGVLTMKVGGRRKLIIPPQLAYGERGVQGSIPPHATVVFEIELLSISQPE